MVTVNLIGKLPFTDSFKNYGFLFTVFPIMYLTIPSKLFFRESFKIENKVILKVF